MRDRSGTLTRSFRIAELLELADEGRLVLPEFQRDFDWSDERVVQLLATIARRWPAGSLLLQDFPGETFYRLRQFEGGPPVNEAEVEYVVLDGQQRLTALYHAIFDAGPYVYAIRTQVLQSDATIDEIEEGIASFSRLEWDNEFREGIWDIETDWIPFYSLRSPADFFGWRDQVAARSRPELQQEVALKLADAYRNGLEAFHTYALPAVIVERELEPAAIARIFERVNRGNLALNAFDLMVAKSFETGWNLRDKWEAARDEFPVLEEFFGDDGMPVIRVIALKDVASVREGDVLRLPGLSVRSDWDQAASAMARTLNYLRKHCGVEQAEWLPYGGMAITLAGLAFEHDLEQHADVLRQWFLSRAFGLRYESGANTVTVDEHLRLRRVLTGEAELDAVAVFAPIIREATRKRRSAIWRAFMCALALNGARDPLSGEAPDGYRGAAHILPREESPPPDSESQHLLVLNLMLVDAHHVSRLNGIGLDGLVRSMKALDAEVRSGVIESQMLPQTIRGAVDAFLDGRLEQLDRFLRTQLDYGLSRTEDGGVVYVITPRADGRWDIRIRGAEQATATATTRGEAIERARALIRPSDGGEILVRGHDGRLQSRDTYGHEPTKGAG